MTHEVQKSTVSFSAHLCTKHVVSPPLLKATQKFSKKEGVCGGGFGPSISLAICDFLSHFCGDLGQSQHVLCTGKDLNNFSADEETPGSKRKGWARQFVCV